MTRRSVDIDGFRHANPIPGASRVGPLVASSVISGRGGDGPEAQIANLFRHVGDMLHAAGADWRHVVKMNFYVPDLALPRVDQRAVAGALPRPRLASCATHPAVARRLRRDLRLPRLRRRLSSD